MHFVIDTRPTLVTLPPSTEEAMQELGERLEAMIALVADSFPADWSYYDRRWLAMKQLGMLEDVA